MRYPVDAQDDVSMHGVGPPPEYWKRRGVVLTRETMTVSAKSRFPFGCQMLGCTHSFAVDTSHVKALALVVTLLRWSRQLEWLIEMCYEDWECRQGRKASETDTSRLELQRIPKHLNLHAWFFLDVLTETYHVCLYSLALGPWAVSGHSNLRCYQFSRAWWLAVPSQVVVNDRQVTSTCFGFCWKWWSLSNQTLYPPQWRSSRSSSLVEGFCIQ